MVRLPEFVVFGVSLEFMRTFVAAITLFLPAARPATASDELGAFVAGPGLRVELVADGDLVRRPLAMRFSADGRLWVLEADGTAKGGGAGNPPGGGSLVVLEDANHDGRMDRRTVFVAGFSAPRGLVLLGDGALVADGVNFLFLRDHNGDPVASETIRVATDPSEMRNRPEGPNGLFLALDNWIYTAGSTMRWDPLESTCRHASLSIL